MNFDETVHAAARIGAVQGPAHLERARHTREATPVTRQRSRLARQVGACLNRAGRWLQGLPLVVEPPRSLGQIGLADMTSETIGQDSGECRPEPPQPGAWGPATVLTALRAPE
jgi:hypothetical protein